MAEAHKLASSFVADPHQYMDVCKHPEHLVMVSPMCRRPRGALPTGLIRGITERRDDHERGHVGAALGPADGVFPSELTQATETSNKLQLLMKLQLMHGSAMLGTPTSYTLGKCSPL